MRSILFQLGPVTLRMYGCMMAIGFIVGWYVVSWLCRREGRKPELLTNLLMLLMVSGVAGARIAYVIEHWRAEFANNLAEIIRVDHGGLMFYGGLILAFLCFVGYCIVKRERFLPMADMLSVVVPLGHAFGRIGCFFNGCCYGKQTDSAFGVSFPAMSPAWCEQVREHLIPSTADKALPVLPTQLFEAAGCLVIFAIVLAVYLKSNRPASDGSPAEKKAAGLSAAVYLASYGVLRFLLEMLRGDPRAAVLGLSIGQTISLGVFLTGLVFAIAASRRRQ